MSSYISSSANRLYVAAEADFGVVPEIDSSHRIPAVKLKAKQQMEVRNRQDKTGSRTFAGLPAGSRRRTSYELQTYMTTWGQTSEPAYGPMFRAGLGGNAESFGGGVVAAGSTDLHLAFTSEHGLTAGQAVVCGGEMRFVASVVTPLMVEVNAPFSQVPVTGSAVLRTVTYRPQTELGTVSIFDYWVPSTSVQRIVCGAAVDKIKIQANGDFHGFEFTGPSQELMDSCSFEGGGGMVTFPPEPAPGEFDYSIVPGHLGQAWLGAIPERFYTVTNASFLIDNDVELRANEFGSMLPRSLAPGKRGVTIDLELFAQDDDTTKALYQAARSRSPISVMFQLGQSAGQIFGIYMKSVIPEVPEFDDSERRLQWRFRDSQAQGTIDDEIVVAFG